MSVPVVPDPSFLEIMFDRPGLVAALAGVAVVLAASLLLLWATDRPPIGLRGPHFWRRGIACAVGGPAALLAVALMTASAVPISNVKENQEALETAYEVTLVGFNLPSKWDTEPQEVWVAGADGTLTPAAILRQDDTLALYRVAGNGGRVTPWDEDTAQ